MEKKPLWHDWIKVNLFAGLLLELLVLSVSVFAYGMRFPKLNFEKGIIPNLAFLLLLFPLLNGIFGFAARESRKAALTRFFTGTAIPSLVTGILMAVFLCLFPPYCSSTENPGHYLVFDRIDSARETEIRSFFPAEIPANADGLNYRYYKYSDFRTESFHLSLSRTLSDAQYTAEKSRITALPLLAGAEESSGSGITLLDITTDSGIIFHAALDDNYRRIICSASYRIPEER